tara:strand:- start:1063 stop:1614 length:552 start_codon:yes stop_codon:yes gene_type:complete
MVPLLKSTIIELKIIISFFLVFFITCTKKLENQVEELKQANNALIEQLNNLIVDMDAYEAKIAILEYQLNNPNVSFDSPYIGCWTSTESLFETEIQILPNGVGTLDFSTSVYQVFSWDVYEGKTILHFGDISWCSCFGITEQGFVFGEMYEENQELPIEVNPETFSIIDFDDNEISYTRCTVL